MAAPLPSRDSNSGNLKGNFEQNGGAAALPGGAPKLQGSSKVCFRDNAILGGAVSETSEAKS